MSRASKPLNGPSDSSTKSNRKSIVVSPRNEKVKRNKKKAKKKRLTDHTLGPFLD